MFGQTDVVARILNKRDPAGCWLAKISLARAESAKPAVAASNRNSRRVVVDPVHMTVLLVALVADSKSVTRLDMSVCDQLRQRAAMGGERERAQLAAFEALLSKCIADALVAEVRKEAEAHGVDVLTWLTRFRTNRLTTGIGPDAPLDRTGLGDRSVGRGACASQIR
jgi:hypothetical protein